jgi:hypothetical protein
LVADVSRRQVPEHGGLRGIHAAGTREKTTMIEASEHAALKEGRKSVGE